MSNNLLIVPSDTDKTLVMVPVQAVKQDLVTKTDYLIYVPLASKEAHGTVKIGDGISVINGVISIDPSGEVLNTKVDKYQGKDKYKQALIVDSEGYVTTGYAPGSIDVYKNASLVKEDAGYLKFSDDFTVLSDISNGVDISLRNPVPLKTSDLTNDGDGKSPYATQSYVELNGGKIDYIYVNDVEKPIINKTVHLTIPTKLSDLGIDKDIAYLEDVDREISTHNNDVEAHPHIQTKLLEVEAIAKGRSQIITYTNYMYMVRAFNTLPINEYSVGQSVFIKTLNVPDLWISSVDDTSELYAYTSDDAILEELKEKGYVKIGYYTLSPLETEKVDLTNYVSLDGIQTVSGIKTFTSMIGLLNSAEGEADFIKHINNNFLITSYDGKSLLNIDEQLEKIYSFNKELANKDYVKENYLSFTEAQSLTEEQQALIRSKIGAGSGSFSGVYKDLYGIPYLNTNNSASLVPDNEELLNTIHLHKVSKTGLLSDLSDDINHRTVTDNEKNTWNNKLSKNDILKLEGDVDTIDSKLGLLETSYNELYNKVPTKTSQLENDSGFITSNDIPDTTVLYNSTGQNTDGAMTQKATTDELNKKVEFEDFGEIDFTPNLQTQINELENKVDNKANKDLSNVTYPQLTPDGKVHTQSGYTTYMSTDSNTWYILYPTGKKECGVSFKDSTDGDTTVTLPISFNSTSFVCTFSGGTNDVYAMIRIEKLDKNKVRVRFAKSFNTVNPYPSYGCLKCEGI